MGFWGELGREFIRGVLVTLGEESTKAVVDVLKRKHTDEEEEELDLEVGDTILNLTPKDLRKILAVCGVDLPKDTVVSATVQEDGTLDKLTLEWTTREE